MLCHSSIKLKTAFKNLHPNRRHISRDTGGSNNNRYYWLKKLEHHFLIPSPNRVYQMPLNWAKINKQIGIAVSNELEILNWNPTADSDALMRMVATDESEASSVNLWTKVTVNIRHPCAHKWNRAQSYLSKRTDTLSSTKRGKTRPSQKWAMSVWIAAKPVFFLTSLYARSTSTMSSRRLRLLHQPSMEAAKCILKETSPMYTRTRKTFVRDAGAGNDAR